MREHAPYKKALMLTMAATLSVSLFGSAVTARSENAENRGSEKSQRFGKAADQRPATINKGKADAYRPSTVGKVKTPAPAAAAVGASEIIETSPVPTPEVTPTPKVGKKQVCERIINRSAKLATRITHAQGVFSGITTRVNEYYTGTVVPAGGNVENYQALLSNIAASQEALENATETASSNAQAMSCDTPKKEAFLAFHTDLKAVNSAAKAYRASVAALVAAVEEAAASLETPSPTPSADPEATAGPEVSPSPEASPAI